MKQSPSQLLTDDDGHWYLVPETEVIRFETALDMWNQSDGSGSYMYGFGKYRIDDPSNLRILAWEEMS